jgi:hypothetical protein
MRVANFLPLLASQNLLMPPIQHTWLEPPSYRGLPVALELPTSQIWGHHVVNLGTEQEGEVRNTAVGTEQIDSTSRMRKGRNNRLVGTHRAHR